MRLIPCQSSSISGIAYEPGDDRFFVCFANGTVYEYTLVQSPSVAAVANAITRTLFDSVSQGTAFTKHIRTNPRFSYRLLSPGDVEDLNLNV